MLASASGGRGTARLSRLATPPQPRELRPARMHTCLARDDHTNFLTLFKPSKARRRLGCLHVREVVPRPSRGIARSARRRPAGAATRLLECWSDRTRVRVGAGGAERVFATRCSGRVVGGELWPRELLDGRGEGKQGEGTGAGEVTGCPAHPRARTSRSRRRYSLAPPTAISDPATVDISCHSHAFRIN